MEGLAPNLSDDLVEKIQNILFYLFSSNYLSADRFIPPIVGLLVHCNGYSCISLQGGTVRISSKNAYLGTMAIGPQMLQDHSTWCTVLCKRHNSDLEVFLLACYPSMTYSKLMLRGGANAANLVRCVVYRECLSFLDIQL